MHFKWRFPQDITRASDGGALSVSLEAGPAGQKEPCNGAIAAISDISIAGSAGISFPLSDDDMKVMDVDRFFSRNYGDAWAGRNNKWQQLGGKGNLLGCAASDEAEAGASPQGTTGRYAFFGAGDGGLIVWHGNGPRAGQAFEVHGYTFKL